MLEKGKVKMLDVCKETSGKINIEPILNEGNIKLTQSVKSSKSSSKDNRKSVKSIKTVTTPEPRAPILG